MLTQLRKMGLAVATAGLIVGATVALPDAAQARWGGWHGGGWHGGWRGGGWGWGGFGIGLGTGLLLGAAPYWGGYGYGPGYAAYGAPYGGGCYITRRWVWNGYGQRVLRRVRVCY